ncbi:hypothetical protein CABS01_11740 [Colletotrichum abscissum]|uniref:uncharacterized protein n=1 Tax=Colletotrichum abscissum TaxID=1671311 RepID=UPI0027D4DE18|nr:uncharacterized protein CABS01_11740 [Colletotrichum abscissum]KAK1492843.1 hypothetical protein CABS01_11740 [Colletotrichum abscissum]
MNDAQLLLDSRHSAEKVGLEGGLGHMNGSSTYKQPLENHLGRYRELHPLPLHSTSTHSNNHHSIEAAMRVEGPQTSRHEVEGDVAELTAAVEFLASRWRVRPGQFLRSIF